MPDYAPGVPMWIDVSSPDPDKSRSFYCGLFGWDAFVVPDPQAGGYTMMSLGGKSVGAVGPMPPGAHPAWMQYVHTTDANATAAKVKQAGGEVVTEPMDVMGQGRFAVLRDPTGAHISLWEPQAHTGAELVNEPGSFSWSELYTRDLPKAVEFYKNVFGWGSEATELSGIGTYTLFQVDGRSIAGGLDMSTMLPASIPPHWLIYFTVANAGDTIATAKDLGGEILDGPKPTPMGPMAVIRDPVGAVFAVIQINQET